MWVEGASGSGGRRGVRRERRAGSDGGAGTWFREGRRAIERWVGQERAVVGRRERARGEGSARRGWAGCGGERLQGPKAGRRCCAAHAVEGRDRGGWPMVGGGEGRDRGFRPTLGGGEGRDREFRPTLGPGEDPDREFRPTLGPGEDPDRDFRQTLGPETVRDLLDAASRTPAHVARVPAYGHGWSGSMAK